MLKSQGVVRRIITKDDRVLVSFPEHDGYFTVPEHLRGVIHDAHQAGREVSFTYDIDLNLLDAS